MQIQPKWIFIFNKDFFPYMSLSFPQPASTVWLKDIGFSHDLLLDIWAICWDFLLFWYKSDISLLTSKGCIIFWSSLYHLSAAWFQCCCKLLTFEDRDVIASNSSPALWVTEFAFIGSVHWEIMLATCSPEIVIVYPITWWFFQLSSLESLEIGFP